MPTANIDPKTLKSWLDQGQAVLVDVRGPAEHAAGHIPGDLTVSLGSLLQQARATGADPKVVLYCRSGRRAAMELERLAADLPSAPLFNLEGGFTAWKQAGLPVKADVKAPPMPVERQTQIAIGLMVLLGVALGYGVHPDFFLLAGFFGAGLTFAGITGFCGLAVLIAKMPWNRPAG